MFLPRVRRGIRDFADFRAAPSSCAHNYPPFRKTGRLIWHGATCSLAVALGQGRCGVRKSGSRREVVFVQQSAEPISPLYVV